MLETLSGGAANDIGSGLSSAASGIGNWFSGGSGGLPGATSTAADPLSGAASTVAQGSTAVPSMSGGGAGVSPMSLAAGGPNLDGSTSVYGGGNGNLDGSASDVSSSLAAGQVPPSMASIGPTQSGSVSSELATGALGTKPNAGNWLTPKKRAHWRCAGVRADAGPVVASAEQGTIALGGPGRGERTDLWQSRLDGDQRAVARPLLWRR